MGQIESLRMPVNSQKELLSPVKTCFLKTERKPQLLKPKPDGFEPFVNPEPTRDPLFINGYNGNFCQQMELNREKIEKVLKVAHLDGKVVLTSLVPSRNRSIDGVNADGSTARKRNIFWGEKLNEEGNPLRRVVLTPQGWRIEINDTGIRESLEKKKLTARELTTGFIKEFDSQLTQGLWECVWREKLTGAKDKLVMGKYLAEVMILVTTVVYIPSHLNPGFNAETLIQGAGTIVTLRVLIGFINAMSIAGGAGIRLRSLDNAFEYFMPYVEIDKVARSVIPLVVKGGLVREKKN